MREFNNYNLFCIDAIREIAKNNVINQKTESIPEYLNLNAPTKKEPISIASAGIELSFINN